LYVARPRSPAQSSNSTGSCGTEYDDTAALDNPTVSLSHRNHRALGIDANDAEMHEKIYRFLVDVAKRRDCTTYAELAKMAGFNASQAGSHAKVDAILAEISTFEHQQGRPLLSAVVLCDDANKTHLGFFTLARELRLNEDDDVEFFIQELRRVHNYWSNAPHSASNSR
jgi:hypothetical protein